MRNKGSIRDVALNPGLSIAAVSRVFNGAKNDRIQTRGRVLGACRELDYLPNPAACALTTNKSRTLAAIIPTIEHSINAKYIAGIEQTLGDSCYSIGLSIIDTASVKALEAARKLLGMGADAFILAGSGHRSEMLDLHNRRAIPCVFTSIW